MGSMPLNSGCLDDWECIGLCKSFDVSSAWTENKCAELLPHPVSDREGSFDYFCVEGESHEA